MWQFTFAPLSLKLHDAARRDATGMVTSQTPARSARSPALDLSSRFKLGDGLPTLVLDASCPPLLNLKALGCARPLKICAERWIWALVFAGPESSAQLLSPWR
jgi:hypothetical protein